MDVQEMMRQLSAVTGGSEAADESSIGKEASAREDATTETGGSDMEKVASDLAAAGCIAADSFMDRIEERLEKIAANPDSHASAGGVKEPSMWSRLAEGIQGRQGGGQPDADSGHTRAEAVYPGIARSAGV